MGAFGAVSGFKPPQMNTILLEMHKNWLKIIENPKTQSPSKYLPDYVPVINGGKWFNCRLLIVFQSGDIFGRNASESFVRFGCDAPLPRKLPGFCLTITIPRQFSLCNSQQNRSVELIFIGGRGGLFFFINPWWCARWWIQRRAIRELSADVRSASPSRVARGPLSWHLLHM